MNCMIFGLANRKLGILSFPSVVHLLCCLTSNILIHHTVYCPTWIRDTILEGSTWMIKINSQEKKNFISSITTTVQAYVVYQCTVIQSVLLLNVKLQKAQAKFQQYIVYLTLTFPNFSSSQVCFFLSHSPIFQSNLLQALKSTICWQ